MTTKTMKKLQTYINHCLRRILKIHWTDKVTNEELCSRLKQLPIDSQARV